MNTIFIIGQNKQWQECYRKVFGSINVICLSWKSLARTQVDITESTVKLGVNGRSYTINQHTLFYFSERQGLFHCYKTQEHRHYQQAAWYSLVYFLGQQFPTINPINPRNSTFSDAFYCSQWHVAKKWGIPVPSWCYQKNCPKGYKGFSPGAFRNLKVKSKFWIENYVYCVKYDVVGNEVFCNTTVDNIDAPNAWLLNIAVRLMNYYDWQVGSITFVLTGEGEWVLLSIHPELGEDGQMEAKVEALKKYYRVISDELYINSEDRPNIIV